MRLRLGPRVRLSVGISIGLLALACGPLGRIDPTIIPQTPTSPPVTLTPSLPDNAHRIEGAQGVIEAVQSTKPGGDIPEHFTGGSDMENFGEFEPERGDFDPDLYFNVLPHLAMEEGYTLDYVYQFDGMGGFPILFARDSQTGEALRDDSYVEHIQTDGTPEGFFELALLEMIGGQFYLWWHAGYNDHTPVAALDSAQTAMRDAVEWCQPETMPPDAEARLAALDFTPMVTLNDDTAQVRFIAITAWGGFYEARYIISREFPHTILERQTSPLLHWECGIVF